MPSSSVTTCEDNGGVEGGGKDMMQFLRNRRKHFLHINKKEIHLDAELLSHDLRR